MTESTWTRDELLRVASGFQAPAVLAAAAELDLFAALRDGPAGAGALAGRLGLDRRGLTVLLDALVALGLLAKGADRYRLAPGAGDALGHDGPGSVRGMVRHQANCMRRWARLAATVRSGRPPPGEEGPLGDAGDLASFIQAMHDVSAPMADALIGELPERPVRLVLDLGGASGTWTAAWLRRFPAARAILFDLPGVVPLANRRLRELGLRDRVELAAGDYLADPLPRGADTAWISAIVHQLSLADATRLLARTREALAPGGVVYLRDIVMAPSRTEPPMGALFAVNMLAATEGGGTYTFDELGGALESAGFTGPRLLRRDDRMNSIVAATAG